MTLPNITDSKARLTMSTQHASDDDSRVDDVASLSTAIAKMRLEQERTSNDGLRSRVAHVRATLEIMGSTVGAAANLIEELRANADVQLGGSIQGAQMSSLGFDAITNAAPKRVALGKRKYTISHSEAAWWRTAILQEASATDPQNPHGAGRLSSVSSTDDDDVVSDPTELGAPADADDVHSALRHELMLKARLHALLEAHENEHAALQARLAYNEVLICRLEQVNASLLAELKSVHDATVSRPDVLESALAATTTQQAAARAIKSRCAKVAYGPLMADVWAFADAENEDDDGDPAQLLRRTIFLLLTADVCDELTKLQSSNHESGASESEPTFE
eukprot:CAMPEP_0119410416 /NCGR_PEP_ID=MMETSP1335-20130426/3442_1 /TAXON_ID=259385 /ORGANISM="Chrysoculter rhomboideus, Strain RCC1486" /LENGTH=334 /DNA_ID=CAMNT_0007434947 /DNA_START=15 /DNA_END=1021 /DNA_ORIENTATION=+